MLLQPLRRSPLGSFAVPWEAAMVAKKTDEEQVPEGSVQVESVRNLEGFDAYANIPVIATWRDVTPESIAATEKLSNTPSKKEHN